MDQEIPKALFIGNGINRVAPTSVSWGSLLENLSQKFNVDIDLQNDLKPFPLAFEEMLIDKLGTNPYDKLKNMKRHIGHILTEADTDASHLELHAGIMQCGIPEIITTNYDYNLERSIMADFDSRKRQLALNNQESKHSLFRGYRIENVTVRHIHGEVRHNRKLTGTNNYSEESIMIGFEHYADYALKIQDLIYGLKDKRRYTNTEGILGRMALEQPVKSWTDLFFTHNMHFVGFTLDFSESHLWWLLMQRQEIIKKFSKENFIKNTITFHYPEMPLQPLDYACKDETAFNTLYRRRLTQQKNKAVTDILKALSVAINPIKCGSYLEFYARVLEEIKS